MLFNWKGWEDNTEQGKTKQTECNIFLTLPCFFAIIYT